MSSIPLYDVYGFRVGNIAIEHALKLHGTSLCVRARGTGRRRHFTSAKLFARSSQIWMPRLSARFVVMQLITE